MLQSLTAGGSFNATRLDSRVRHPTARPRPYALEPDLYWLCHDVACASGRSEPFLPTEPNIVSDQSQMQLTVVFLYLPNRPKTSGCCPSTFSKTWPNTSSSCQGKLLIRRLADSQIQRRCTRRRGQRHSHHLYHRFPVAWLRQ